MLNVKLIRFELIKYHYVEDLDLTSINMACEKGVVDGFYKHNGYLFRIKKLCIPGGSMRELLVREAHGGGPTDYFGEKRTSEVMKEHFIGLV